MGLFSKKKKPEEKKVKGRRASFDEESEDETVNINHDCGAFMTRKVFNKSFDDTIWDAMLVMTDFMENIKECADDPNFYLNEVFQDPCPKGPMFDKTKKQNEPANDGYDDLPPHLRRSKK
ncbi:hypothetical protein WA026_015059 [Henosepilachna vigintioctopunctata]|uniref:Uncharacterized protein n=1 Tax=Henosepilachna vigintioctopunctata TaxID=420089 RepID=A0AAW1TZ10_9CUCU